MACRQSKSANCKLEQKYRSQRVPKNPKPNAPSDIFKRIDVSCCSSPCDDDNPDHVTPVPIIKNAMTEVIRCARDSPYVVSQKLPVIHAAEAMEYEMENEKKSSREKHHREPCTMLKIKK